LTATQYGANHQGWEIADHVVNHMRIDAKVRLKPGQSFSSK
jgi:hypothetical protein